MRILFLGDVVGSSGCKAINENLQNQPQDVLSNAPEKLENYFAVPKVVD